MSSTPDDASPSGRREIAMTAAPESAAVADTSFNSSPVARFTSFLEKNISLLKKICPGWANP
jgi:hypothetical protein